MLYCSSAKLVNKFKINRENYANERNYKVKKENLPIELKRKKSDDFIQQQGKSEFVGHKSVIQSSPRKNIVLQI